jgi:hypothetical protein
MKHARQPLSGQALVADYQTVFVSTATIEAASYEATRSENELVQQLERISAGTYLNPGALAATDQDAMTRASLDAHIKKVQAQQLHAMNAAQMQQLIEQDRSLYKGRKVHITVRQAASQPVDIVWFDQQNGYRTSPARKKTIVGTVEDVLLDRNLLILRPALGPRLMNSRLQNYLVYIIDPQTFSALIDITVV